MRKQFLRSIGRISGILARIAHIGPTPVELITGDAEYGAERYCIERCHILRDKHYIVRRLIEDEQFVVAVIHQTAGRINDPFKKRIAVGVFLIFAFGYLKAEQSDDVYRHYNGYEASDSVFAFF